MIWPVCGGKTAVIDSKPEEDQIIRVRKCQECGDRFSTIEVDLDLYERLSSPVTVQLHLDGDLAIAEMQRTLRSFFRQKSRRVAP